MTEQLYLADSSVRSFEATVERTLNDRVVLDRSHFYPTGGGQPHDTGTLAFDGGEAAVTDVAKTDTVYHTVDGPTPEAGTTVRGELDWERRSAHMRYHTAQHLLSAVLLDEFDAETVGNQLYADRARLDASYPKFSETDLADVEARLNELVDDDLPVRHYTMERERAEAELDTQRTRIDLLPDSIAELRIVEVGDPDDPFDRTACAGTHVAATGELDGVEVTGRTTQGSETERVTFTLG
ncbi:alanyl-tRNA editing protein [Candidatus Halobonum tyrrellensis]|uniref:Alanine--tRNA ligase n=1 Tax=Candidatus Halobonum tyrrellensis G22 TaxID=1324957 RepID=V4HHV9_9EURY|nr:alanyl-tRNA editing protein [Candidatus Halobonum tyrrellensis]ESP89328.1 alanine--tRNA ligase [Candidatus Halobonum tyrrellensis G22]